MECYKLRITPVRNACVVEMEELFKYFDNPKVVSEYCYCIESRDTENMHYHFYLKLITKVRNVRNFLTSKAKLKGNASYSMAILEDSEENPLSRYIGYMMKEGEFYPKTLNMKLLEEGEEVSRNYQEGKKKEKKMKKDMIDELQYMIEDRRRTTEGSYEQIIQTCIFEYYKDNGLRANFGVMRNIYQTILLRNAEIGSREWKNLMSECFKTSY